MNNYVNPTKTVFGRRWRALRAVTLAALLLRGGAGLAAEQEAAEPNRAAGGPRPAVSASQPAAPSGDAGKEGFHERNPRYRIGRGDILELDFPFVAEFNQTVSVQPDGYVNLKSAGDLYVAGLTTPELIAALKTSYSKILHDPIVSVLLKEFEKPYFTALGKVIRPGKYDLRGETTVSQAVAIAGGLDDAAKHSQILLFRKASNDGFEVKTIDLKRMLRTGDLREDIVLQPGDMVFVPKSLLAKVRPWIPSSSMGMFVNGF